MAKNAPYIAKPETEWWNMLIYGSPGVGKTTFAATAQDHPAMKDVLFLNVEGGLLSVAGRGDIAAIDIRSAEVLEEVFWEFVKEDGDYKQYKTVVLDSGTEAQNMGLEQIVREAMNVSGSKREDRDKFYLEDYGKSNNQLTRLFRWFRDAPIHFIMTATPKNVYPKGSNENVSPESVQPSFTAKLAESAQGFMDFVWYMYIDPSDNKRKLLTSERPPYKAKTRGPRFAEAIGQRCDIDNLPDLYELFIKTEGSGKAKPAA